MLRRRTLPRRYIAMVVGLAAGLAACSSNPQDRVAVTGPTTLPDPAVYSRPGLLGTSLSCELAADGDCRRNGFGHGSLHRCANRNHPAAKSDRRERTAQSGASVDRSQTE